MKRLFILFIVFTAFMAQDLKLRGIIATKSPTYFGVGADYKLSDVNKMPLFGTANLMFGSDVGYSVRILELGGTLRHQINKDFYAKGGTLLSFRTHTIDIIDESDTDTKFTLLIGAGYLINKQFSVVLDYGLTGADMFRIQLGFDL